MFSNYIDIHFVERHTYTLAWARLTWKTHLIYCANLRAPECLVSFIKVWYASAE